MATEIIMRNQNTGISKNAFVGFSWTYFFFGFFVPLFRQDMKLFVICLIMDVFTFFIAHLVMCFFFNKIHMQELIKEGYIFADTEERNNIAAREIGMSSEPRVINQAPQTRAMGLMSHQASFLVSAMPNGISIKQEISAFNPVLIIGRSARDAQFIISDDSISRAHAKLEYQNGRLILSDLNSTNGTKVNGQNINSQGISVDTMDKIKIGSVYLMISHL